MNNNNVARPLYLADSFDDEGSVEEQSEISQEISSYIKLNTGCCKYNPISAKSRQIFQFQMILLPFIPIAILIIQNCYSMSHIINFQNGIKELETQVDGAMELGVLLTALQQERAEVAYYIFTNGSAVEGMENRSSLSNLEIRKNLDITFRLTDQALEDVHTWPNFSEQGLQDLHSKLRFQIRLEDLRGTINAVGDTVKRKMDYYNHISSSIMESIIQRIKDTSMSSIWKLLVAYKDMVRAVEYFGISLVEGLNFFGEGKLSGQRFANYIVHDALAWKTLNQTKDFVTLIKRRLESILDENDDISNITFWRLLIIENVKQTVNMQTAEDYFDVMVRFNEELRKLQMKLLSLIKDYMKIELRSADANATVSIFLLALVLVISPLIIFFIRKATQTIQIFASNLTSRTKELKREKRRCDRLIYQMLPEPVAKQLKRREMVPAESYEDVTVYFSDIVGFTSLASDSSPMQVISLLNSLYNLFDSRIEKFDVYKVETIGDAYMVVSGVPHINGIRHVSEIANMSLDLIESARSFEIPHRPDKKLLIRAGFNSGPVVAGVVGTKMPRYCLFGDTVNTASRMESSGESMKVHITQTSKEILERIGGYTFEFRGYHELKGKGTMPTFWLTSGPKVNLRSFQIPAKPAEAKSNSNK